MWTFMRQVCFREKSRHCLDHFFFFLIFLLLLFTWVKQLLRGMRLSFKKPAKCLQELHSTEQALLADEHTRSQRRPAGAIDRPRRQTSSAAGQHEGRPRHSRSPSAWTVARWTCWCRLCTLARQTPSCRSCPPEHTHHVTSENGWATTTTLLQLTATLENVLNPSKEGPTWILL